MKAVSSHTYRLRQFGLLIMAWCSIHCLFAQQLQFNKSYNLQRIQGKAIVFDSTQVNVFIFYSPQCPICINLTKTVGTITAQYGQQVNITLVYPGTYYTNGSIRRFQKKYKLKTPAYRDADKQLVAALNATVTPQAFVINKQGEVIYSGKIDNQYEAIGKRRTIVTEHYLRNAIESALAGDMPAVKQTEAVGCFIE